SRSKPRSQRFEACANSRRQAYREQRREPRRNHRYSARQQGQAPRECFCAISNNARRRTMSTDRRTFLKAGAALAAGGTAKLAHSEDTLKARADDVLKRAADAGDVPGVVAVATNRQGDIYEGGFGNRMTGESTPMTADTVFWIASMTKAITGAAAMQLVEQGKVNLDSPASHWVPDLARAQVLDGWDADGQPRLRAP